MFDSCSVDIAEIPYLLLSEVRGSQLQTRLLHTILLSVEYLEREQLCQG